MVRQLWDRLMATEIMLVCNNLSTGENVECKQCGHWSDQCEITFISETVEVGLSSLRKMVITGSVSTSSLVAMWRGDMTQ